MLDLKGVKIFSDLSDSELKALDRQMREIKHEQGSKLMIRGSGGVGFMVILDGEAEVTTADGRTRTLGPGDHFGEMTLVDREARSAEVVAKTDLRLRAIPEWGFRPFLKEHPDVTYRLLETMSQRLRDAEAR